MVVKKLKVKVSDMKSLFPLIAIADKVEMGKTKALIYAFKLGFRAGKMELKEELLNNFCK